MTKMTDFKDECENNENPVELKRREIDLRPFRRAIRDLARQLHDLGVNHEDPDAEDRRVNLLETLKGVYDETECDQTMIAPY